MKGGYQILDLTGATAGDPVEVKGIYKAAAGNNGKPVLILTNDGQRVYAKIAEDDGDYITCYISAEGKTVKVTITDEDAVTTVIEDDAASIEALTQGLNEVSSTVNGLTNEAGTGTVDTIEDRVDANNMADPLTADLTEYDGSAPDKIYTTPADGYVWIRVAGVATNIVKVNVKSPNNTTYDECVTGSATNYNDRMVYVKKGMLLSCNTNTGDNNYARFLALS